MILAGIVAAAAMSQASSEGVLTALEQYYDVIRDAGCAFEGEFADIDRHGEWAGEIHRFVGRGGWHKEGVVFVEHHQQTEHGIVRFAKSLDRGGNWVERTFGPSKDSPPAGQVQR